MIVSWSRVTTPCPCRSESGFPRRRSEL
jgi:hypothetical protein